MAREQGEEEEEAEQSEQSEGQVSEAGGALNGDETDLGGADAVPDKTSGSAVASDDRD